MTARRTHAGFTLVETLVAVTLLALLFGALLPVFQNGLAILGSGDRHTRAALLAQSLLERESLPPRDAEGLEAAAEGVAGDLSWRVEREPYVDADDGLPPLESDGPFRLVRATVTVTWAEGGEGVRLSTLVLEPDS